MAGRQVFSEREKLCLQELIIKYKINSHNTPGIGNIAWKRNAWARLTKEFNSVETNVKRTEAQLKKLWDNLKTRRKRALAQQSTSARPEIDVLVVDCDIPHNVGIEEDTQIELEKDDIVIQETEPDVTEADVLASGQKEFRASAISKELKCRLENYNRKQEMEEELHKIKLEEAKWLLKTAEEKYKTAKLERERAEELLKQTFYK